MFKDVAGVDTISKAWKCDNRGGGGGGRSITPSHNLNFYDATIAGADVAGSGISKGHGLLIFPGIIDRIYDRVRKKWQEAQFKGIRHVVDLSRKGACTKRCVKLCKVVYYMNHITTQPSCVVHIVHNLHNGFAVCAAAVYFGFTFNLRLCKRI